MKSQTASAIAVACFLQIGCATTNDAASQAQAAQPRGEAIYQTGSAIPRRSSASAPITTLNGETLEFQDEYNRNMRPIIAPKDWKSTGGTGLEYPIPTR